MFFKVKVLNRPVFQKYNDEVTAVEPYEFSPGTLEWYKTSLSHTVEFMKWKFNFADINIRDFSQQLITDYDFFLHSVRKCAYNTTVKYIENFKKIIGICIANGWVDKDLVEDYSDIFLTRKIVLWVRHWFDSLEKLKEEEVNYKKIQVFMGKSASRKFWVIISS